MSTEQKPDGEAICDAIRELIARRGHGRTACPSEVARSLAPDDWRALMPAIRAAAASLWAEGAVVISQRGRPVDPASARGPIRLGLPDRAPKSSPKDQ